jgi:hypothetical protein
MSAVHIDLIIGNRHNGSNEQKPENIEAQQSLPHTAENLSKTILGIPNLPGSRVESIAEDITKINVVESA